MQDLVGHDTNLRVRGASCRTTSGGYPPDPLGGVDLHPHASTDCRATIVSRVSSPGRGLLRLTRGIALAGVCMTLSMTAHVVGGGRWSLSPGVLLMTALLAGICVAAADRQRGFRGILTVVGLSQVVLHLLPGGAHSHVESGSAVLTVNMVAAHAVVTPVISMFLALGERLVWSLFALLSLRRVARLLTGLHPDVGGRSAPPAPMWAASLRPAFPRADPAWRGPPLLSN